MPLATFTVTELPMVVEPFITEKVTVPSLTGPPAETVAFRLTAWTPALNDAVAELAAMVVDPAVTLSVWLLSVEVAKLNAVIDGLMIYAAQRAREPHNSR